MSPELRDLIGKLMNKNPDERIKLEDIRRHAWLAEATNTRGIEKLQVSGIVDRELMKIMQELEIDVTNLAGDMEANKVNSTTAVYKMLRKKRITEELNVYQQPEDEAPTAAQLGTVPHLFSSADVCVMKPISAEKKNRAYSVSGKRPMLRIPRGQTCVNKTAGDVSGSGARKNMFPKVLPIVFASAIPIASLKVLEGI